MGLELDSGQPKNGIVPDRGGHALDKLRHIFQSVPRYGWTFGGNSVGLKKFGTNNALNKPTDEL